MPPLKDDPYVFPLKYNIGKNEPYVLLDITNDDMPLHGDLDNDKTNFYSNKMLTFEDNTPHKS